MYKFAVFISGLTIYFNHFHIEEELYIYYLWGRASPLEIEKFEDASQLVNKLLDLTTIYMRILLLSMLAVMT